MKTLKRLSILLLVVGIALTCVLWRKKSADNSTVSNPEVVESQPVQNQFQKPPRHPKMTTLEQRPEPSPESTPKPERVTNSEIPAPGFDRAVASSVTKDLLLKKSPEDQAKADLETCKEHLSNIVISVWVWRTNVHMRYFPDNLLVLSNVMDDPSWLVCPSDNNRPKGATWDQFTPEMISYRIHPDKFVHPDRFRFGLDFPYLECTNHYIWVNSRSYVSKPNPPSNVLAR